MMKFVLLLTRSIIKKSFKFIKYYFKQSIISLTKCLCKNIISSFSSPTNQTGFVKLALFQSIAVNTQILLLLFPT